MYYGNDEQRDSLQNYLLVQFGPFKNYSNENIDQVFERYNHLIIWLVKYHLKRQDIEKVTFLQGHHPEWKTIVSTMKAHKQFKQSKMSQVVVILKSHEEEVFDVTKPIANVGPLALDGKEGVINVKK